MRTLLIVNDPPYGSERAYSALRLGNALIKRLGEEAKLFLLGDAVSCAKAGQTLPQGYYNLERMLKVFHAHGGAVGVCGSCMDARGLNEGELGEGARRSSLEELAEWTLWADKVLVF